MSSAIGLIYLHSIKNVQTIYNENIQQSIIDVKKIYLKDTVNNVLLRIEQKKKDEAQYYQQLIDTSTTFLRKYYHYSPDQFLKLCINYFNREDIQQAFTILIIEQDTNQVVYDNKSICPDQGVDFDQVITLIQDDFSSFHKDIYGNYKVFFGVTNNFIDQITKKYIATEIHTATFSEDTYIWVNEVIDYNGGENYAIRRIHPNLIETEGMSLSTSMTDIKGNLPYLAELEGVKKDGEIFFTYYFKKKNSEVISEKLTYAKLYKDYNWIIAMGIHLDDIQAYFDKTSQASKTFTVKLTINIILLMFFLATISFVFLVLSEKWYFKHSNKKLEEEINFDPLTKAYTRRAGLNNLAKSFKTYQKYGHNPAVILFDVDDFKKINDTYGHDVGDHVLATIVKTVKSHLRSTDKLYRWGGEEFLLVCDGLKAENALAFSKKFLHIVSEQEYLFQDKKFHTTISMGISYFDTHDQDFHAAIKRADIALYKSKNNGKNQVHMEI
jgi:diguanylate cyclase (GGDEF)-like protein